ncbi:glycerophosphodiester phosphodiesterase family protein [Streptomyces sp. NPDC003300]|uniref:glycerophosphodiester phosphodiesterase family protein n=1 Tax=unclassified Streptomyces TaxID=2593676 RepID=UPI0033B23BFF
MTYARAVPEAFPDGRPVQVVAHRGASADVPEHTLAAYRKAIEDGADALDCDVRLTSDGELVCVHDRRVDRTSNGRGAVSSLALADLAALDFGSWKDGRGGPGGAGSRDRHPGDVRAKDAHIRGARAGRVKEEDENAVRERSGVLTLRRLLELVADTDRRVEVAIETKHPTRWSGQVERRLLDLLRHFGMDRPARGEPAQVRVMSFSPGALRRVRLAAPAVPTVFLVRHALPRRWSGWLPAGVGIAGPSMRIVRADPGYVARLRQAGHRVHVWTVDEPADVELCVRLGVDSIITNRPSAVLSQLGR